jgi:dephospho-CoA kinase
MARSNLGEPEVRRRIAAQGPPDDKVRRADYVIRTDGTVEETRLRAAAVWEALDRRAIVGY